MTTENLWGVIPAADPSESPFAILSLQGNFLSEQTSYTLQGVVRNISDAPEIVVEFGIRATLLNNYEIMILRASHGAMMYPVTLRNMIAGDVLGTECINVEAFKKSVADILRSAPVQRIVSSLLAQSKQM